MITKHFDKIVWMGLPGTNDHLKEIKTTSKSSIYKIVYNYAGWGYVTYFTSNYIA